MSMFAYCISWFKQKDKQFSGQMPPKSNNACHECGHNVHDHEGDSGCLALHNDDRNKFSMNILAKRVCSCLQEFSSARKKYYSNRQPMITGPKRKLWEILPDVRAL